MSQTEQERSHLIDEYKTSDRGRQDQNEQWVRAFNAGYKAATKDRLANGERVGWCGVHGAPSWDERDLFCMAGPGDSEERSCRMVSKLLIDPTTEEER